MRARDKILTLESLKTLVTEWKRNGHRVVFTNGCFDLLHLGHVDYLEKAREQGDKLVVGINSDASVKRLKGHTRPIIPEISRATLLASLMFVDAVVLFDEDTPYSLISVIVPDILIKGNDYTIENIVGADFVISQGGKVSTIELVPGFSTSSIVEKIKNSK